MKSIVLIVLLLAAGCKRREDSCKPQEDTKTVKPVFAGCFAQHTDDKHWYWQCENAEGLWKCDEKMERASCTWESPLPVGHPLRRDAEEHLADAGR